jgi:thiamin-phosphate kinase
MKNREYQELKKTLGTKVKSKQQINRLFEADCEILKLSAKNYLSTSIDSISDEIDVGLYKEIETWAWMTVMASVSDLSASGSTPLGLTLSTQWKNGSDLELHAHYFKAINAACKKARVPFLGGDSGSAMSHVFTSSIIGQSSTRPLMRIGAKAGDLLVLHHQKNVGAGPALAYRFLMNAESELFPEKLFRPTPSWEMGVKLKPYAHASIDTSDGIASCVSTLCQLNNLGAELIWDESINHPQAMKTMKELNLSPLFLWLGDHGDYQTLFCMSEKNYARFAQNKNLGVIGKLTKKKETIIHYRDQKILFPFEKITTVERDLKSYVSLVKEMKEFLAPYN